MAGQFLGNRLYRATLLLLAIVCFAAAPLGAYHEMRSRRDAVESPHWPSVAGTMRQSFIEEKSVRQRARSVEFRPQVEYEYIVDGHTYRGSRISAAGRIADEGGFEHLSRDYARLKVERYPVGSTQRVYYRPEDPGRSVLERGHGAGHDASGWAIGILLVMGSVLLYVLYGTSLAR